VQAAAAAGNAEQVRAELGDLLFAVVNLGRFLGCEAEDALGAAVGRFAQRFRAIESRLHAQGKKVTDCSLAELDALWDQVKQDERLSKDPRSPDATRP
jgi:tetrapyrrole methylase family protein/MazG family protein